jgi:predicted nucleotidyltransferase
MDVDTFLQMFIAWVGKQQDIEGLALAGSHARNAATEQSDVDLIILTSERDAYFRNVDWLSQFGEVESFKKETWGVVETIRATYTTGLEVEYNFADPTWADVPVDPGTRRVVKEGFRILFDPQRKLQDLTKEVSDVGH